MGEEEAERAGAVKQKKDEKDLAFRNKEERDWSDLPIDILRLIIGKLFWSDRIRIRAVCKSWLPVSHDGIPTIDKQAWRMDFFWTRKPEFDGVISICKLTDMSVEKAARIDWGIKGEERAIFVGASFWTSSYGWLLFKKRREKGDLCNSFFFFLYSPFSDEVIELPMLDLNRGVGGLHLMATFYLSSANPDCLVFCLHRRGEILGISTCRPGDETWKTLELQVPDSYCDHPRYATYFAGSFYCVFLGGQLGAFNVARQEWTLLVNSWPDSNSYIAELIAVPRFQSRLKYNAAKVLKFDYSEKRWVEESQEEVLSDNDFRILSSSSQATGEAGHLYAYVSLSCSGLWRYGRVETIAIEPPLKGIWRRRDLLQRS